MDSSWLFNLGADIYAWFTAQAAWRASCTRLAEELDDLRHPRVVDLGCGPGVSTFQLAERLEDARLIGVDIAPRMLRQAARRGQSHAQIRDRITWLLADAARLPLETNSVDACTGHSFLYLVADRAAVLSEVRRALRPGGRLVLMEPNQRSVSPGQVLRISRDPRHLLSVSLWRPFSRLHGRFSQASLAATLASAGFERCRTEKTFGGLGLLVTAVAP